MKSFNPDGTLTEEGKKEYKKTQQRKASKAAKKAKSKAGIRSSRTRGFNFYSEMEVIDDI